MRHTTRSTRPASLGLVDAVELFVHRIESLADRVHRLEDENAQLRTSGAARADRLKAQVAALQVRVERMRAARTAPARGRRTAVAPALRTVQSAPPAPARTAERRRTASARPAKADRTVVSDMVIRATIGKLGTPTASEIAQAITRAGAPVSGRAVRFFAERAGATPFRDAEGVRRYRLAP